MYLFKSMIQPYIIWIMQLLNLNQEIFLFHICHWIHESNHGKIWFGSCSVLCSTFFHLQHDSYHLLAWFESLSNFCHSCLPVEKWFESCQYLIQTITSKILFFYMIQITCYTWLNSFLCSFTQIMWLFKFFFCVTLLQHL